MAAFKLIILKSKFSHDIIPEHTHTHGHVYIFPFEHKHLQAFCLLATSHMINLGSIAKKVTVSGTAKELRAVATPQATSQQLPAEPSTGKDPTNSMVTTHLFDMMEKQARALDALSQKILNNDSLEEPASSNSLLSDGAGPRDSTSLTPKALPGVPAVLPLHAPSDCAAPAGGNDGTQAKALRTMKLRPNTCSPRGRAMIWILP